jgi:hypothetical protein
MDYGLLGTYLEVALMMYIDMGGGCGRLVAYSTVH